MVLFSSWDLCVTRTFPGWKNLGGGMVTVKGCGFLVASAVVWGVVGQGSQTEDNTQHTMNIIDGLLI